MKIVLLRVGIDSGSGGAHGPLFRGGSFEFLPIPDTFGIDERTYGSTAGRFGQHPSLGAPPARGADRSLRSCPGLVFLTSPPHGPTPAMMYEEK